MSEVPVQVVVAAWNDERTAGEALSLIKTAATSQARSEESQPPS